MTLEIPGSFDKPENCFIIRVIKTSTLLPKYLYYVFQNMYLNSNIFNQFGELTITELRNVPMQATKNFNTEPIENKDTEERLGDVCKIINGTETIENDDIIIKKSGPEIGNTIILEDKN